MQGLGLSVCPLGFRDRLSLSVSGFGFKDHGKSNGEEVDNEMDTCCQLGLGFRDPLIMQE